MPAPSRGEFGFERAGQQWTEDREPAFVEEVWAKLNGGEVFEEFACLLARIDSRDWTLSIRRFCSSIARLMVSVLPSMSTS